ncbi:MAG: guanylate kinase [Gemmatimonadota bacterium]|nr:MAG: guanylate kinase [Gemmatimonadota bacterium]
MKSFAVAICAPSGTGKTTVARALTAASDDLVFSVSATTRAARAGERDGVDYHFVGRGDFEQMIAEDALLEWAEVHGELYGTPRRNLEEAERLGRRLILDIDVQGARQVKSARPDSALIFLLPPSFQAWVERLRRRGSEDEARVRRRLETARAELQAVDEFQYVVVNDRLEEAVARLGAIVAAEGQRLTREDPDLLELRRDLEAALARALA